MGKTKIKTTKVVYKDADDSNGDDHHIDFVEENVSDDSSAEEELPEVKALNAAKKKLLKSGVKRAPQKLNYCADMEERISDYKKKITKVAC